MYSYSRIVILLVMILGCSSPRFQEISSTYEQIHGRAAQLPDLERSGHRLFIYLEINGEVFTCLAVNRDHEVILVETHRLLLAHYDTVLTLYVTKLDGPFEEMLTGVDYYVHAVRFKHAKTNKYLTIFTEWRKGMDRDVWRQLLQGLVEKGMDKAL